MSISVIRATFDCDGCGKQFRVDMEPAHRIQGLDPRWFNSVFDLAVDCVRGGTTSDGGLCSVQHSLHLCEECTSAADSIGAEDYQPTREEILEKIGAA